MQPKPSTPKSYLGTSPETEEDYLMKEFYQVQQDLEVPMSNWDENFRRWIIGLHEQPPCTIPRFDPIVDGNLCLYQMEKTDPRGIFGGLYIGCCQHPQGWAKRCVWYGHESCNSEFWAVKRYEDIVAVAWVWRHLKVLMIDSVEVNKKLVSTKRVHALFREAAEAVLDENLYAVYAGLGYKSSWPSDDVFERPFRSPAPYFAGNGNMDDSRLCHMLACNWPH